MQLINLDNTPLFVPSVAMFCYHFRYKLRVSAWAVGSCSIGPPAGGILENIIFQTLRLTGRIALYKTPIFEHFLCVGNLKTKLKLFLNSKLKPIELGPWPPTSLSLAPVSRHCHRLDVK